jgi:hypothetical protein
MDQTGSLQARRAQSRVSLLLLALLLATCLGTDLLARNRGLERLFSAESRELADKNHTVFSYTGNFIDFEERLVLDEIPRADFSNGGVYFFGTSNVKWAFQTWDLPADQRQYIGNYGIGASNHKDQLEFIRYLIEQRGFLAAGDRDLVVLGVSFHLAHADSPSGGYWASLLRRRGLYAVAADGRVAPVSMNGVERWLRVEQARCAGFIWNLGRLAQGWLTAFRGSRHPVAHDGEKYRQGWRAFMGDHWQQNLDVAMNSLRETISLVKSHHAKVKVMLLPQGIWMDPLPFKSQYEAKVRDVCAETNTPLIDRSHAMGDEDFVDSNHLTVEGQERFRTLLMDNVLAQPPAANAPVTLSK